MLGPAADVLPDMEEEDERRVPVGAVRDRALQRHAVAVLRSVRQRRHAPHHHQRLHLLHADLLHYRLHLLRHQEGQGDHHEAALLLQHRGLRRHLHPHPRLHPRPPPRQGPRLDLHGLLPLRLRRPARHRQESHQDQERRVHAHLPLLLPHPKRRHVVHVWLPQERPLRRGSQHSGIHLRDPPDGVVLGVPEEHSFHPSDEEGAGGGAGSQGGDRHVQAGRSAAEPDQPGGPGGPSCGSTGANSKRGRCGRARRRTPEGTTQAYEQRQQSFHRWNCRGLRNQKQQLLTTINLKTQDQTRPDKKIIMNQ